MPAVGSDGRRTAMAQLLNTRARLCKLCARVRVLVQAQASSASDLVYVARQTKISEHDIFVCDEESHFYSQCIDRLLLRARRDEETVIEFGSGDGTPVLNSLKQVWQLSSSPAANRHFAEQHCRCMDGWVCTPSKRPRSRLSAAN